MVTLGKVEGYVAVYMAVQYSDKRFFRENIDH